jgi:hypothetical protein
LCLGHIAHPLLAVHLVSPNWFRDQNLEQELVGGADSIDCK